VETEVSLTPPVCEGLTGPKYLPLFDAVSEYGGTKRGFLSWDEQARFLFPYKFSQPPQEVHELDRNINPSFAHRTPEERNRFDATRKVSDLWQLYREGPTVRSTSCEGTRYGTHQKMCRTRQELKKHTRFRKALSRVSHTAFVLDRAQLIQLPL
jgi:hypothetical protein